MQLNASCRQLVIGLLTCNHLACHLQHKLTAQAFCGRHDLCSHRLRIDDQLHNAFTVAQINENQTAQIPTAGNPALQSDFLTNMLLANTPSIHRTFHLYSPNF